jgi:lipopolysaccharide export system protein LptA
LVGRKSGGVPAPVSGRKSGFHFSWICSAAALVLLTIAFPAAAQETQESSVPLAGLKLSGDEPIQIESDRLEVRDQDNRAIFTGNVSVVQGESLLKAGRMIVYYMKNGSAAAGTTAIDHLEFSETVYLQSKDQVATGDHGTFDMKTSIFTLTGKQVVLTQGENVLVGCKLVANTKAGTARVDGCPETAQASGDSKGTGRIKMILKPGGQTTQ